MLEMFCLGFLVVSGGSLNLVPVIPSWPAVGHLICIFSHEEDCSSLKGWKVFHGPVVLPLSVFVEGVRSLQLGGPGTPHLHPWSRGLREHVWAGDLCFTPSTAGNLSSLSKGCVHS